jgi:tetratricopeptide (TPR) repeat protein
LYGSGGYISIFVEYFFISSLIWDGLEALINTSVFLNSGAGANAGEGAAVEQVTAVNVAKECLLAALKPDPKAAHIWANLANAYYMTGDHRSSGKCLEKVLMAHC